MTSQHMGTTTEPMEPSCHNYSALACSYLSVFIKMAMYCNLPQIHCENFGNQLSDLESAPFNCSG